jgi:hypothetical protein
MSGLGWRFGRRLGGAGRGGTLCRYVRRRGEGEKGMRCDGMCDRSMGILGEVMMGGVGKCWFGWGGVNGCAMTE